MERRKFIIGMGSFGAALLVSTEKALAQASTSSLQPFFGDPNPTDIFRAANVTLTDWKTLGKGSLVERDDQLVICTVSHVIKNMSPTVTISFPGVVRQEIVNELNENSKKFTGKDPIEYLSLPKNLSSLLLDATKEGKIKPLRQSLGRLYRGDSLLLPDYLTGKYIECSVNRYNAQTKMYSINSPDLDVVCSGQSGTPLINTQGEVACVLASFESVYEVKDPFKRNLRCGPYFSSRR